MSNYTYKKKRGFRLGRFILMLLLFLLCMIVVSIAFYIINEKKSKTPINMAAKFADAMVAADSSYIFSALNIEENDFINEKTLNKCLTDNFQLGNLTSYSIVQYDTTTPDTIQYHLHFETRQRGRGFDYDLNFVKDSEKLFYFFDNWKIDPSNIIARGCKLDVPNGSSVYIDGIPMNLNNKTTDLFQGSHTIKVSLPGFNDYNIAANIAAGNHNNSSVYKITTNNMVVSQKTHNDIIKCSEDLIKKIYSAALNEELFTSVTNSFTFNPHSIERLEQNYDALVSNNISSQTKLTDVNFTKLESSVSPGFVENNFYAITVTTNAKYVSKSRVVKNAAMPTALPPIAVDASPSPAPSPSSEPVPSASATPTQVPNTPESTNKSTEGHSCFSTTYYYSNGIWYINNTTILSTCVHYLKY